MQVATPSSGGILNMCVWHAVFAAGLRVEGVGTVCNSPAADEAA